MIATTCLDRQTLLRYSVGMLSEEDREALESHLDDCSDCQTMIATLDDADDTAIGRLRAPLSGESVLDEPQLLDALKAAMAMPEQTADTADMPQMLGEYRLIEELGHGGMGRVYKALHTKLDRVVAIKISPRFSGEGPGVRAGRAGDENAANRFAREMKAVGRLVHPNIVQAYDAREIDSTAVLIMELVDGLDLAEIVRRTGALSVPDACELVRQTSLALQCAHEHGLVHRDVKPSNIMLARSGEVKLLDLGLAKFFADSGAGVAIASPSQAGRPLHAEEMTGTGQAMGTADYMAPEQASDSRTVDIRADIYSLGCTFYKLLTGRAPFSGPDYRTTLAKMNAHINQPVPPIRQIVPEVPEQLAAVLDRMLAKDPAARFGTPAEVSAAIAPFCGDADLVALLKRAEASPPLPSGEGRTEDERLQIENCKLQNENCLASPSGKDAGGEGKILPSPTGRGAGGEGRWKSFVALLVALALVGGLGVALGILITIKKDGKTYQIEVDEGSRTTIDKNGNATVDFGQSGEAGVTPIASPQSTTVTRGGRGLRGGYASEKPEATAPSLPPVITTPPAKFRTATITRGDLTPTIDATGTIEPEEVVDVSVQVEGAVIRFGDDPRGKTDPNYKGKPIDYGSPVEVNSFLAEIDPAPYKARRDEAAADLKRAEAELSVALSQVNRAKQGQELREPAEAALAAARATVDQKKTSLELAQTNLDRTVIRSPVKGVVVDRRVNVGQIVGPKPGGASQFLVAKDIEKLHIWVHVNEADIGRIKKGMDVRFRVDAFPDEVFRGKVAQIRLDATTSQNVVYYTVVVTIDNPDRRLMPYMTANVSFQIETRHNVLRAPNAAVRFRAAPEQIAPEAREAVASSANDARHGQLWVIAADGQHLRPIAVERGITDGTVTEVSGPEVKEGMEVVTGMLVGGGEDARSFAPRPFRNAAAGGPAVVASPTVRVTQPVVCNVSDYEEYTGRIEEGMVRVPLPFRGTFVKTYCKTGTSVHEGELLGELVANDDPKLAQAREALRRLEESIPRGQNRNEVLRLADTAGPGAGSAEVDEATSNLVKRLRAAREEVLRAQSDAPRTKIVAPISGKLVISQYSGVRGGGSGRRGGGGGGGMGAAADDVKPINDRSGEISTEFSLYKSIFLAVGPHATEGAAADAPRQDLAVGWITSPDSMVVTFDVPENVVLAHRRNSKPGWELSLPVVCALGDDKGFPYRGKVVAIAEKIDPEANTQRWQAVVPNKDGLFMPGMSVRVRVVTSEPHKVMLVPSTVDVRILAAGDDDHRDGEVHIVNSQNLYETRIVKIGRRQYDRYHPVLEGLDAKDWVALRPEGGRSAALRVGDTVEPEKVTTPPPAWASQNVAPPAAPPAVSVVKPIVREVTDNAEFVGRIEAAQTAEIRARVSGNLDRVLFKPGESVKKGELLFQVDPRLYQAEFDRARAGLTLARARLDQAQKDLDRAQALQQKQVIPQSDFEQAKSHVNEEQAATKTAEAAVETAQVRLDYASIRAPFDGRISRAAMDAGNLVTADKTVLATLVSTDPMCVCFAVDERTVLEFQRKAGQGPAVLSLPVACGLPDEQGFPHRGTMDSAEATLDPATGTARWRATLSNKEGLFLPGMFVRVQLTKGAPYKALLIPERALSSDRGRAFVFVVNERDIAERRDVKVGSLQDGLRIIAEGLTANDWVITSNREHMAPDKPVKPEKTAAPSDSGRQ